MKIWRTLALLCLPALLTACNKVDTSDKGAPSGMTYARGEELELHKARVEALSHWSEFVSAFEKRKEGDRFAVKACFQDGNRQVHKWLIVDDLARNNITGHFAKSDSAESTLKEGQSATALATNIEDWSYIEASGTEHGGYTIAVLRKNRH